MSISRTGSLDYIVCTSSTRPAVPATGTVIYETDTDLFYVWDGSDWAEITWNERQEMTQSFNTAGADQWEAPAGVTSVFVECWGGGGAAGVGSDIACGGGGGAAYASGTVAVTPGNTYDVQVGTTQQDSFFIDASTVMAAFGQFGGVGSGGAGGLASASVGTVTRSGGAGGNRQSSTTAGGGGGGSATALADGTNGGNGAGGVGGAAGSGEGAGGKGGNTGQVGQNGFAPGGGAGGRGDGSGLPLQWVGADGRVTLTWLE